MFNPNKITKILGATFILVSSNAALAATAPGTVSVTVQNTFNLTETQVLDFGTIRAKNDNTNVANFASLIITPNGTATPAISSASVGTVATITSLSTPTMAIFTVDSAAPFTDLEVTFPPNFTLTTTGVPANAAVFNILNASWKGYVVGGTDDGTTIVDGETMQTDAAGAVVLQVGTSLDTDILGATTTSGYVDQAYTGTYTMTVDY
tara:strand:- start:946 stop:1566 length:621 start_codon:yes stop_codon:yes gene_type:complete